MEKTSTNQGITYGVISGILLILLAVMLYVAGVKWFVHPVSFLAFLIPIVVAVLGGLAHKKANGGYLEFKDALKTVFTIFVIGSFMSMLFYYVLLNYIDVPFRQALAQESAAVAEKMMEKFNMPQDQIDKAVAETLNGNSFSFGKQFLNFALGTILWFLFSLIIAAIIKKKKPMFDEKSFQQ